MTEPEGLGFILKSLLSPKVYDDVVGGQEPGVDKLKLLVERAIQKHDKSLTEAVKSKLNLLVELADDLNLPSRLCNEAILHSNCFDVQAVITHFWASWSGNSERRADAIRLFEAKPAIIIKNLVAQDHFGLSLVVQQDVIQIFDNLGSTFNILKNHLPPDHRAITWLDKLEDPGRKQAALAFIASVQQLCRVIIEPMDLPALISLGFSSVEQTAYTPLGTFEVLVAPYGISSDHARRIHGEATSAQMRMEQSMMALLQSSYSSPSYGIYGKVSTEQETKAPETRETNLSKWFGDLDQVGCEDCCSVTSPAAYLVDLFRLLKNIRSQSTLKTSILEKLFERRPDLGNLLLSCRNTSELVPYIDLVNETLESVVIHLEAHDNLENLQIETHDADSHSHVQDVGQFPHDASNTRYEVYDKFIINKVHPSTVFPYDHSKDTLKNYLTASSTTSAELFEAFRADPRLIRDPALGRLASDKGAVDTVYSRVYAAEILGMAQADYLAITLESFYDLHSARLVENNARMSQELYQKNAGLLPSWYYWGYEDENPEEGDGEETILDAENGDGLPFIKAQLLPRLDVQFSILAQILNTRFLGGCLTVSLVPEGAEFDPKRNVPGQLDGFRLRGKEGESLDVYSCQRLDQFVRIWRRLGWSIEDVDDALFVFGVFVTGEEGPGGKLLTITPGTIEELAAISEISRLTKIKPPVIVSLFSQSSQYFLGLPIIQTIRLQKDQTSNVEEKKLPEDQYLPLLLSSLNISYDDFVQLQEQEHLGDDLSMTTVFKCNRLAEAAKMFSVNPEQISKLLAIFSKQNPSFSTPKTYLKALKTWRLLQEDGWDAINLISVSTRLGTQVNDAVDQSTMKFIGTLMGSIKSAEKVLALSQPKTSPSSTGTRIDSLIQTQSPTAVSDQSVFTVVSGLFSKTPPEIVKILLDKSFPDGRPTLNSQILSATEKTPGLDYEAVNFTGALIFVEDAIIHLETSLKTETETSFRVGETTYVLTKKVNGEEDSSLYESNIGVSAGSAVHLLWPSNFSNTRVTLKHPDGTSFTATEAHPISTKVVLDVQHAIDQIGQNGILLERYPVSASELEILLDAGIDYQGFDIVNGLQSYFLARKALVKAGKEVDFARFTQRLLGYQVSSADLVFQFNQVTILSKSMAEKLLLNNLSESGPRSPNIRLKTLFKIGQQVQLMARMGLAEDALELLFTSAEPPPFRIKNDWADRSQRPVTRLVQLLHAALTKRGLKNTLKTAQNVLRENRRNSLIQYILQNDDVKYNKGVTDADGLFRLFLIDVQMGSGLETTRIKQAISTVQLFVHRCLLGLEEDVDGTLIPQDRWAWMSRYNLWEANRKVFLYPENWADPALRDSKTPLFRALEDDIMKSNLDERSIINIIRTYVCSMDEVANLQVQSFYWDKPSDPRVKETGIFHIVARTRNAPYQYYYRQLEYLASGSLPAPHWSAWEKLPFDVRAHDVDHDGKALAHTGSYVVPAVWKNRLIIFLPRISVSAVPNDNPSTTVTLSKGSPSEGEQEMKVGGGNSSNAQLRLEIKMAWSERVDGVWLAQKQSQDTLTTASGPKPPPFDSFRFSIYRTEESLSMLLYQVESSSEPTYRGQFRLHGPRLSFIPGDGKQLYTESNSPKTRFGQLCLDSVEYSKADNWSSISQPPIDSSRLSTVSWTLDCRSDTTKPLGLVADLAVKDGRGYEPWFTLPTALFGGSKKGNDIHAYQLFNHISDKLRAAITNDEGVDAIYRVMDNSTITRLNVSQEDQNMNHAFGSTNQLIQCRENATPYSIYNWEVGFHLVSLLVERLMGLQAFDLAIKYAHLVFDPTGTDDPKPKHPTWRFPPFRDNSTLEYGKLDSIIDKLRPSEGDEDHMFAPILAWRRNPFKPHTVACGRPLSYMKRFAIKYMEALIASGDVYFRQNSLETIHLAIERYIEASHVFGPRPQVVPRLGKQQFKSYNDLSSQLDDFSNASVKLELSFPYYVPLQRRGASDKNDSGALQSFLLTRYFGVQANPEFMELRSKIDKRLYQIRNSLDINGNPRTLSLWDPPLDVGDLVAAFASGSKSDIASVISGFPKVMPRQRFMFLMQKAYELCSELKNTSATLLSAIEKGDGEALQLLHSNQDTGMQRILMEIKLKQKGEAQAGLQQLLESRKSAVVRFKYYAALTGDKVPLPATSTDFEDVEQNIPAPVDQDLRLSRHETLELDFADSSSFLNGSAALLDEIAAAFLCVPMPALNGQPMGVGVSVQIPNPGQFMQIGASSIRANALKASEDSQRASRIAQWTRQLQERRLQLNLAGHDIKNIDKQMEIQAARITVIDKEMESQKQIAENLLKIQDFLCTKFSNKELYSWYESSMRNYLYQTYLVTMELVRKAEVAYLFEQGPNARSTLSNKGYWDQGKRGLQCGEQLWFALKQMELSYLNEVRHDFEITKSISLRQLDPVALLNLREMGEARFDLPEVLFDLDFPGHYFRRIKSVSLSFPCITGPYVGINCTATLLQHQYRVSDSTEPSYLSTGDRDTRFAHDEIQTPIRSVCISSGHNDAGVFEPLDFHGERYQPFEGAGVISSWNLRLPKEYRAFDYRTISDVVMQIRYTAKNGGESLTQAASKGLRDIMEGAKKASQKRGLSLLLDIRSDYSDAWYSCTAAPDLVHKDKRVMSFPSVRNRLPFFARGHKVTIKSATLYVTGPDMSKYKFYISKSRENVDTGTVMSYDNKLGDLQLFQSPSSGGTGLDAICNNGNGNPAWYLTMKAIDGGEALLVPTNLLVVIDYSLTA